MRNEHRRREALRNDRCVHVVAAEVDDEADRAAERGSASENEVRVADPRRGVAVVAGEIDHDRKGLQGRVLRGLQRSDRGAGTAVDVVTSEVDGDGGRLGVGVGGVGSHAQDGSWSRRSHPSASPAVASPACAAADACNPGRAASMARARKSAALAAAPSEDARGVHQRLPDGRPSTQRRGRSRSPVRGSIRLAAMRLLRSWAVSAASVC